MATKTWKIEKDLCRCCHAEGAFDNLSEPRIFLEKEEVYSDMLRECLDIDIPAVPGELSASTYTICNTCIGRLRDACNFKKQVQDCEQRFMTLYYKNAIQGLKPETKVKEELEVTVEDSHSDMEAGIVLKKEDTDDDDHLSGGGGDDDMSEDDLPIKRALSIAKTRPKPKPKPKAPPVKKEKPPPKPKKKAEEPKPAKEKKGTKLHVKVGRDYRKDGDRFICEHCDKFYVTQGTIYFHIHSKHSNMLKPKLNLKETRLKPGAIVCGEDYTRIDGDKFRCARCDKICNKENTMRRHVRADHYGILKFTCPVCEEGFKHEAQFMIHKLKEHELDHRYDCKACDGKFNSRRSITDHVRVFHKQGEKHKCPLCDYESYKTTAIRKHMYKHNRQKNKKCQSCNKAFARLATLRQHERIHKGDKRSVCKVCDEAFVQKASLNYHMTKYHPSVNF